VTSSRFAVAIHLLALATQAGAAETGSASAWLTSERMAERVGTNPVVVRRILGALRETGLVASHPGPGGGWRPTRPAERTTLLDVYRAVMGGPALPLPPRCGSGSCPIGRQLHRTLDAVFGDAEAAMERELAAVTVADVVAAVHAGGRVVGTPPAASAPGPRRDAP
jgi:Rrf2 family protein